MKFFPRIEDGVLFPRIRENKLFIRVDDKDEAEDDEDFPPRGYY